MSDLDITPPYFDRTQDKNLILQNFIETLNNTQTNLSNIDKENRNQSPKLYQKINDDYNKGSIFFNIMILSFFNINIGSIFFI